MGVSVSDGPYVVTGNTNPQQNSTPEAGPSPVYQGGAILDPRWNTSIGQALGLGRYYAVLDSPFTCSINAVPQALSATRIFPATVGAAGAIALPAQGVGVSPNIPVVPLTKVAGVVNANANTQGATNSVYTSQAYVAANTVNCLALDFGFAIGATTAGSGAVTLASSTNERYFYPGQKLLISGAGNVGNTAPLACTVTSISGTALVVSPAALGTVAAAQIGTSDIQGQGTGGNGVAAWPYQVAGATAIFDPAQVVARVLSTTTTAAGQSGCTALVTGYDIYGAPMTELITLASAGVANGKKAWKYIQSIVLANGTGTLSAGNVSIGTTDVIGFPLRSDFWEFTTVYANGAVVTANTGWTAAVATNPATNVTGDVRGTYALQTPSDGTKRYVFFQTGEHVSTLGATNLNTNTLYGVAQS